MAEDEKAEEAPEAPEGKKTARPERRGRKLDPPVSLYPLDFEQAVDALLEVRPEKDAGKKKR